MTTFCLEPFISYTREVVSLSLCYEFNSNPYGCFHVHMHGTEGQAHLKNFISWRSEVILYYLMTSSLISVDEQSRRVVSSPSIRPSVFITESYNGPPAPPAPHYDEDEELEGQEEEDVMDDSHANLLLPSISTLCNSAIGAGVLSLPIAFKSVGILGACVLCLTSESSSSILPSRSFWSWSLTDCH